MAAFENSSVEAAEAQDVPDSADGGKGSEPLDERYEKLGYIGNGVFGTVYQFRDRETDEIVAVKHLHLDKEDLCDGIPAQVIREVSLLRDFVHPNIAQLRSIQIDSLGDYNLIFEYAGIDLHKVLRALRKDDEFMPMDKVARHSQELLRGIHACHVRLIIHRDLKPQNILIGTDGLKICDFGLARIYSLPIKPYTHDVVTLWYRAPEILLGTQKYGPEVDLWSAGCIISEMATRSAAFPGDSEVGTIFAIFRLLGSPTEETWPGLAKLEYWKDTFPRWPPTNLEPIRQLRPELDKAGMGLLRNLLCLNPQARMSSRRAMAHPFFDRSSPGGGTRSESRGRLDQGAPPRPL